MTPTPEPFPKTNRTTVKRVPKRADYDRATVHAILDEGLVCHVGFAVEGQPFVIPTAYGRLGEMLYLHGSPASRMLRNLQQGVPVCVTVTLLDGLVLARSVFHHSMNYRSVVLFGTATVVSDPEEKLAALKAFTEHVMAGRWDDVRPPSPQELAGTLVLALPITEASAKVRTGPPVDDEADYALPVWAGVLPLSMSPGSPIPDPRLAENVAVPSSVMRYRTYGDRDRPTAQ
jgi:nitroimidazol reductase NimA-like FMN-containing flavoprotein (pyridoxamine 5'-phosphate oxidase superfamily)